MKGTRGLAVLVALLVTIPASAADLYRSQWTGQSGSHVAALTPISITQNVDTSILEASMVHCGDPTGVHADNSHLRRFFLYADHGIFSWEFNVHSVDFGIEQASSLVGAPTQPVDINLYSIAAGASFTFANLTLVGSRTTQIPNDGSATLRFFTSPVTGTVEDTDEWDLVVEMFTPQNLSAGSVLWPGGNTRGQTRPTYIAAADCEIPEPVNLEDIGFPLAHLFFIVHGEEGLSVPGESTSWSRLRAHFR